MQLNKIGRPPPSEASHSLRYWSIAEKVMPSHTGPQPNDASPMRRWLRDRPADARLRGRGMDDFDWLRARPRQQQDQRRVPRQRKTDGAFRDHYAGRDGGEAPAVRVPDAHHQRRRLRDEQEHRLPDRKSAL